MTCRLHRLTPMLAVAGLALNLCAGAAQAQDQGGLSGDFSYTHGSGSGGFGSHSVAVNIEPKSRPLSLGFYATQSRVDSAEVSTQVGASAGWRVSGHQHRRHLANRACLPASRSGQRCIAGRF